MWSFVQNLEFCIKPPVMREGGFYLFIRTEINREAQKTHLAVNVLWEQGHAVVRQFSFHNLGFTSPVSLQPIKKSWLITQPLERN